MLGLFLCRFTQDNGREIYKHLIKPPLEEFAFPTLPYLPSFSSAADSLEAFDSKTTTRFVRYNLQQLMSDHQTAATKIAQMEARIDAELASEFHGDVYETCSGGQGNTVIFQPDVCCQGHFFYGTPCQPPQAHGAQKEAAHIRIIKNRLGREGAQTKMGSCHFLSMRVKCIL